VNLFEGLDLRLGPILGDADRFLRPARQLSAFAGDDVEVAVRELSRLLLLIGCQLRVPNWQSIKSREAGRGSAR
jgi:hypothetical protein